MGSARTGPSILCEYIIRKNFLFPYSLGKSVLNWQDVLWWNGPSNSLLISLLQQLMRIYSVSLCSDQCHNSQAGKIWCNQRKVRGNPSPSYCHLHDTEVLQTKSYEMLPLDPVKELVRITRVKFHNPSMAFRICQFKKKNKLKQQKTRRNQNLSPRILEEKAFILTEIQSWINGNLTRLSK